MSIEHNQSQNETAAAREDSLKDVKQAGWPVERLRFFRREVGLDKEVGEHILLYSDVFVSKSQELVDRLWERIYKLTQVKIVVDQETTQERLTNNWRGWFNTLWTQPTGDELLAALWRSGSRHIQHEVDHRFVSLAYSHMRAFCHDVISEIAPDATRSQSHLAVDKLFDLCLLVETDAYLSSKSRCDHAIMMGVSHQMRNPITIIGGNAMSMKRALNNGGEVQDKIAAVLDETRRLEHMVHDASEYVAILQRDPVFAALNLRDMLLETLQRTGRNNWDVLDEETVLAEADRSMIATALQHLVENAVQAMDDEARTLNNPNGLKATVRFIECREDCRFIRLIIDNPGAPASQNLDQLFQPFHSTKPYGTGMGLPIARLAARKNFGSVDLAVVNGGAHTRLTLLKPDSLDRTGLFFKPHE